MRGKSGCPHVHYVPHLGSSLGARHFVQLLVSLLDCVLFSLPSSLRPWTVSGDLFIYLFLKFAVSISTKLKIDEMKCQIPDSKLKTSVKRRHDMREVL